MYDKTQKIFKGLKDGLRENFKVGDMITLIAGILSGRCFMFYNISPFGSAACMAYIFKGCPPWFCLFPIIGAILSGKGAGCIKYILIYCVIGISSLKKDILKTRKTFILYELACMAAAGLIFILFCGINFFDVALLVLEIICTGVLFKYYCRFFKYFTALKIRRTMTKTELESLSVIFLVMLCSVSDIYFPFDITLSGIICSLIILFSALAFDMGVCGVAGVILGTVMGIANPDMIYCVGAYSVSAVCASIGAKYKKSGALLSFILANAFTSFYVNDSNRILVNVFEVLIAGVILYIIPESKIYELRDSIMLLLPLKRVKEARKAEVVRKMASFRMRKLASAFGKMAFVINKNSAARKTDLSYEEEKMLIENIAKRICASCAGCRRCWIDSYGYTYNTVKKLLEATRTRGYAEEFDLPARFKNGCIDPAHLVLEANKVYELYRVNKVWEGKVREGRSIIGRQLLDVSNVVKQLADDIETNISFQVDMENDLISLLDGLGVRVKNLSVVKDNSGLLTVELTVYECKKNNCLCDIVVAAAERVCEKKMKVENEKEIGGCVSLKICEAEWFEAETAVARVRPKGEEEFGDSYAIIRPDNSKFIAAISDGMGKGASAAKESGAAVDLLRELLDAGIDRETAVKLINSVLILKSYDENYATLDILVFDLYTGYGEFIKTGSCGSYVKKGKKVLCVKSQSLPTGIVSGAEPAKSKIKLSGGDVIIMASDGVCEVIRDDSWIKDVLKNIGNEDVKKIADAIIENAVKLQGGREDDMTVLAVRIKEK